MSQTQAYPNAYCVKCGTHTDTLKKHTVVLQNNSRALKGVCAACESEVFKILPKIRAAAATAKPLTSEEKQQYPDAFCLKCQDHTPTAKAKTVILDNMSRAVHGECKSCGSEVYRILEHKKLASPKALAATVKVEPKADVQKSELLKAAGFQQKAERRVAISRTAQSAGAGAWTYLAAGGVIAGIVITFFVYAVL